MNVFSLSWAAAGLALLGLSLFPAGSLALGGAPAHLAVFLLLLALAALALRLLRREGLDRPRLLDALLPIGLAFFLRALLLDYQSADYQMFLSQWAAAFRDGGGFAAVKLPIGNYNAPYLYFLAAISYLPIPDLYLIKLFSILFDVVLAWGGFRLVRHFAPERPNRPLLCFCLLLLLPTVILNGAFWGQCDALYGALTLHALACALEGRNRSSLLLLGIAFSFKLQTVFVLPLWGGLWLLRRVRFRELLWFPAAYAATCVPALLLGKPLGDILGVYFGQAAEYSGYLNLNAPNMYALIPHGAEVNTALAARLGILAAFALAAAVLAALLVFRPPARRTTGLFWPPRLSWPSACPSCCPTCMSATSSWPTCWLWPGPARSPAPPPAPCWWSWPPWAPMWWSCGGNLPWRSPWMAACSPCCARPCSCWPAWPLRSSPSPAGSPSLKNPESNSLSPTIWHAGTNFL